MATLTSWRIIYSMSPSFPLGCFHGNTCTLCMEIRLHSPCGRLKLYANLRFQRFHGNMRDLLNRVLAWHLRCPSRYGHSIELVFPWKHDMINHLLQSGVLDAQPAPRLRWCDEAVSMETHQSWLTWHVVLQLEHQSGSSYAVWQIPCFHGGLQSP